MTYWFARHASRARRRNATVWPRCTVLPFQMTHIVDSSRIGRFWLFDRMGARPKLGRLSRSAPWPSWSSRTTVRISSAHNAAVISVSASWLVNIAIRRAVVGDITGSRPRRRDHKAWAGPDSPVHQQVQWASLTEAAMSGLSRTLDCVEIRMPRTIVHRHRAGPYALSGHAGPPFMHLRLDQCQAELSRGGRNVPMVETLRLTVAGGDALTAYVVANRLTRSPCATTAICTAPETYITMTQRNPNQCHHVSVAVDMPILP